MQVGYSHEVEKGKAYIRMYTDNSYQDYQIEIDHISYGGQKNLTFTVKSPELLAMTNGIVQGMSGSPIFVAEDIISFCKGNEKNLMEGK